MKDRRETPLEQTKRKRKEKRRGKQMIRIRTKDIDRSKRNTLKNTSYIKTPETPQRKQSRIRFEKPIPRLNEDQIMH